MYIVFEHRWSQMPFYCVSLFSLNIFFIYFAFLDFLIVSLLYFIENNNIYYIYMDTYWSFFVKVSKNVITEFF